MYDSIESQIRSVTSTGKVFAVRGAVVDVVFDDTELPPINAALVVEWDTATPLILEVHSHLDLTTIRAVAFQSTAGLARGVQVRVTGTQVTVPVGEAVLGRLLDVVGHPQDNGPTLPDETPRKSIHAQPPALNVQTRTTDARVAHRDLQTEPARTAQLHHRCHHCHR